MSTALIIFIFSTIPLVSNTSPLLPSISIKNKKSRLFVIDQFPQSNLIFYLKLHFILT